MFNNNSGSVYMYLLWGRYLKEKLDKVSEILFCETCKGCVSWYEKTTYLRQKT